MKKWYCGVITASLFILMVLRYSVTENPIGQSYLTGSVSFNSTNPLDWIRYTAPFEVESPQNVPEVISTDELRSSLFTWRNISEKEQQSLLTWNQLRHLIDYFQVLPNAVTAIGEAATAWDNLMKSIEEETVYDSLSRKGKHKQCPHYVNKMNSMRLAESKFKFLIPCGLNHGSSITIIGIPNGLLGNFQVDLTGEHIPGEPEPPIILHYNVRLHGDKVTEDPVIVQNTWTAADDWGEEERCPSPEPRKPSEVDELDDCSEIVGKHMNRTFKAAANLSGSNESRSITQRNKMKIYFPFRQAYPFVATLRVGSEGLHMAVDGKHITSFAYRETLEPWLVSELRISGDVQLISVLASSLPTSEDVEHIIDLEALNSPPITPQKTVDLYIGVFSTANNFKRRMAVRRTWMQYLEVRNGSVAVRFFVGLHRNQRVNEELWNEARTYGDVQLMPFVDYYSLITWKTVANCIFGTEVVSAKYVMKTDDDAFIRVDEVLASLNRIGVSQGLLYGLINSESSPHRSDDSKWFISAEEWPEETYPPWAHGPGYVVSHDIAESVSKKQREGHLKMFKLEDVAMGIWISEMKKAGMQVMYSNESRVYNEGCKDGYIVAHYQGPREMLCLWQKLQETKQAFCCGDGS